MFARGLSVAALIATRLRVLFGRVARRMGMGETAFLVPLSVMVGVLTAFLAVAFHELILFIREGLYGRLGPELLYGRGMWLLVAIPALGGLAVGLISRKVMHEKEGHGVVDVIESVVRTRGFVRPGVAIEKIVTSAITIGTGGSAGAEGPIVQIGAAVSGGVGAMFRLARHQMPILVGCGCAAGISAIFNAPIGGLLFTLEVILLDFSVRALTPIIVASVVANITMRALVPTVGQWLHHGGESSYLTVFARPQYYFGRETLLNWGEMGNFVFLGLLCGSLGFALSRSMQVGERLFRRSMSGSTWIKALRPALGGTILGLLGVTAVLLASDRLGGSAGPLAFGRYPQPAFYGDGYAVIEQFLGSEFYRLFEPGPMVLLLGGLCIAKLLATVLTLASGGSGGVIAPSLFLGAAAGGFFGVLLRESGWFTQIRPEAYALIGMAAVLAAVVHAPLASILILFEITGEEKVLLPAMLGVVVALGTARLLSPDSLYTAALRRRGIRLAGDEPGAVGRITLEQMSLEPAMVLGPEETMARLLELLERRGARDLVVLDAAGRYAGFLPAGDLNAALMRGDAARNMVAGDLMRSDIPLVPVTDSLRTALELFARYDVAHLPIGLAEANGKVIGLISRAAVMRRVVSRE